MRRSGMSDCGALLAALLAVALVSGCGPKAPAGAKTLVFTTSSIPGGPEGWERLTSGWERENPGWKVVTRSLPNSSDEQHQFYAINLDGGSGDFDILAVDCVWAQEFARAGWLLDLTDRLGPVALGELGRDYFKGCVATCFFRGRCYALPWFMDAGLLYYRQDLLSRYGFSPPATYAELAAQVERILAGEKSPSLTGFVWQGKQYEGLVCAALEAIRGAGGDVLDGGRPALSRSGPIAALGMLRGLVTGGTSPAMVTTADEEAARRLFGDGRAVFMRNWPYAWALLQGAQSAVRGKVGIARVPAMAGGRSSPTLGGWQYSVNRASRHPAEAISFLRYLTRPAIQERMILEVGFLPGRRALYSRPSVLAVNPFVAKIAGSFEAAVPRPLTPYYLMISQVLQSAFSASLAGLKPPAEALAAADRQIAHILSLEEEAGKTP